MINIIRYTGRNKRKLKTPKNLRSKKKRIVNKIAKRNKGIPEMLEKLEGLMHKICGIEK